MSKAAMLPIAKPYPEWMSGRPTERPTIPGRAATLAICFTPEGERAFYTAVKAFYTRTRAWDVI